MCITVTNLGLVTSGSRSCVLYEYYSLFQYNYDNMFMVMVATI